MQRIAVRSFSTETHYLPARRGQSGVTMEAMQTVIIPGDIPVKKNSYRIAGKRMFKPREITAFEQLVEKCVLGKKEVKGKMGVEITLNFWNNRDLDGAATTILDALQDAGLFKNDKDVQTLHVEKYQVESPQNACAVVNIVPA